MTQWWEDAVDANVVIADTLFVDVFRGGHQYDAALIDELFEATIVFVAPRRAPIGGHVYLRPELGGVVGTRRSLAGMDLEVEHVDRDAKTIFGNIVTELPPGFALAKGTTIELSLDEVLSVIR